jgi:PIN domain nuclease of toxin-antitoxin system
LRAFLLDTHVWLWLGTAPERISREALEIRETPRHALYLSAASSWEISIKYRLGKLPLPDLPARFIPDRLMRDRIQFLPIQLHHTTRVAELPDHHLDPFDRLLVAQAQTEQLTIVSADPKLASYDVDLILT